MTLGKDACATSRRISRTLQLPTSLRETHRDGVLVAPARLADLPPKPGVELTQMRYEYWPDALEQTIRYAAAQANTPVYVTESGIATDDDDRRIEYIRRSLDGVKNCLRDKIDVRGYIHWSLLDNFEWLEDYRPKFGPGGRRPRHTKTHH